LAPMFDFWRQNLQNHIFTVKGGGGGWVWGPPGSFSISVGEKYSAHPLQLCVLSLF